MRIEHTVELACTPERLWTYLTEPAKQMQWMKGVLENVPVTAGPMRVGSVSTMKIREGRSISEYRIEVLTHEPGRRLGIKMSGGCFKGMEMAVDYALTDLVGRTRLDYVAQCESKMWLMKLLGPLFRWFAKMQLKSFFRTLKGLAEAA